MRNRLDPPCLIKPTTCRPSSDRKAYPRRGRRAAQEYNIQWYEQFTRWVDKGIPHGPRAEESGLVPLASAITGIFLSCGSDAALGVERCRPASWVLGLSTGVTLTNGTYPNVAGLKPK